jgi:hypothetical protein
LVAHRVTIHAGPRGNESWKRRLLERDVQLHTGAALDALFGEEYVASASAAAGARSLGPGELVQQLCHRFARNRSLSAGKRGRRPGASIMWPLTRNTRSGAHCEAGAFKRVRARSSTSMPLPTCSGRNSRSRSIRSCSRVEFTANQSFCATATAAW